MVLLLELGGVEVVLLGGIEVLFAGTMPGGQVTVALAEVLGVALDEVVVDDVLELVEGLLVEGVFEEADVLGDSVELALAVVLGTQLALAVPVAEVSGTAPVVVWVMGGWFSPGVAVGLVVGEVVLEGGVADCGMVEGGGVAVWDCDCDEVEVELCAGGVDVVVWATIRPALSTKVAIVSSVRIVFKSSWGSIPDNRFAQDF